MDSKIRTEHYKTKAKELIQQCGNGEISTELIDMIELYDQYLHYQNEWSYESHPLPAWYYLKEEKEKKDEIISGP